MTRMFSVPEAAEILGVAEALLRYYLRKGDIASRRIGREYFIEDSELFEAVRQRRLKRKARKTTKRQKDAKERKEVSKEAL